MTIYWKSICFNWPHVVHFANSIVSNHSGWCVPLPRTLSVSHVWNMSHAVIPEIILSDMHHILPSKCDHIWRTTPEEMFLFALSDMHLIWPHLACPYMAHNAYIKDFISVRLSVPYKVTVFTVRALGLRHRYVTHIATSIASRWLISQGYKVITHWERRQNCQSQSTC